MLPARIQIFLSSFFPLLLHYQQIVQDILSITAPSQVFKMDIVMTSTVILCMLAAAMYLSVAAVEKAIKRRYHTD